MTVSIPAQFPSSAEVASLRSPAMTSTRLASRPARGSATSTSSSSRRRRLRLGGGSEQHHQPRDPVTVAKQGGEHSLAEESRSAGEENVPAGEPVPHPLVTVPGHRGDSKRRAWVGRGHAREVARPRGRIGRKGGVNTIFRNGSPNATAATQVAQLQVEEGPRPPRGALRRARGRRGRRRNLGGRRLQLGAAALQHAAGPEGPLLGDLRGRRQPDRLHPLEQHPPAGLHSAASPGPQGRDGGDRGPRLLRPRRRRLRGDRPRRAEEHRGRGRRSREPRRSPSSWSETSTSRTPNRRSSGS